MDVQKGSSIQLVLEIVFVLIYMVWSALYSSKIERVGASIDFKAGPKIHIQYFHGSSQEFVVLWTVTTRYDEIVDWKVGRYWRFQPNGQVDFGWPFIGVSLSPFGGCLKDSFWKPVIWNLASKQCDDGQDNNDYERKSLLLWFLRFLSRSLIHHLCSIVASCSNSWRRQCWEGSVYRRGRVLLMRGVSLQIDKLLLGVFAMWWLSFWLWVTTTNHEPKFL